MNLTGCSRVIDTITCIKGTFAEASEDCGSKYEKGMRISIPSSDATIYSKRLHEKDGL